MAQTTRQAILDAFLQLLNRQPMDKITVTELTAACGVSRNTFYYHFRDIYDLLDELFRLTLRSVLNAMPAGADPQARIDAFVGFMNSNRQAFYHVYKYVDRRRMEDYLYQSVVELLREHLRQRVVDFETAMADPDNQALMQLACYGLVGVLMDWMDRGLNSQFGPQVYRMATVLESAVNARIDDRREGRSQS